MNTCQVYFAATVNTSVLAYASASLLMLVLFFRNVKFGFANNLGNTVEEIVRTMIGSPGLFMVIPITIAFAALVAMKHRELGKIKYYLGLINE